MILHYAATTVTYHATAVRAHGMVRDDPCHLVWQVKKIPWLESIAKEYKTPASLPGR